MLADQVKRWYDIESFGAFKSVDSRSKADNRALRILESTTFHDSERYQVGMLWAEDNCKLPDNYFSALVQLKSLENKLNKNADLMSSYSKIIQDDLDKGYITRVSPHNPSQRTDREWYLPHQAVVNPHKPGKVRRVLNGAFKFHGCSLNNCLLIGPDLLQSLLHVLFRFREHRYAVSADIEAMFMQVGVLPEDQRSLGFLWREDPTCDVEVYQYTRHIFGAKDSPTCSNFALQKTASDHEEKFPAAALAVKLKFYMDDYLDSLELELKSIQRADELVALWKLGGFKLTKFVSNISNLTSQLNNVTTKPEQKSICITPEESETSHVLGLKWNHVKDTFIVSRGLDTSDHSIITQRVILSQVSSVLDPIGLLAPYTVSARLLFKEIWRLNGQQWDDKLPEDICQRFLDWKKGLSMLSDLAIPRCYFLSPVDSLELHVFGDSSQEILCAVAFLRGKLSSSQPTMLSFVFGKARVAPMKPLSIPKLELQASLLAARLKDEILKALAITIERIFLWTDSTTVIQWLHSSEKQPTFVANRVSEILDLTTVDQWNHVGTSDNPADAGTRGLTAESLFDSCWLKGPLFLSTSEWPFHPKTSVQGLLKSSNSATLPENVTLVSEGTVTPAKVFPREKFSSYAKVLRIMAYVMRVHPKHKPFRTMDKSLQDPFEMDIAQQKVQYLAQGESFPGIRKQLLENKCISRSSPLLQYSPFVGSAGLIRSTGRIQRLEEVAFDMKHPILLDARQPVVTLFLSHLHCSHHHQGVDYLRAVVQQKYGILKLRSVLRSIHSRCIFCRKRRAQTITPMMSDLPKERLSPQSPVFWNTGVDYFGPFPVSVRRSTEKRWCFLFTCLTTRAIHIEIVSSMDTSSCIMGIERFIARRGKPSIIWSDNGTNFVAAEKELVSTVESWYSSAPPLLADKAIKWKFNPPAAPHHGGAWERLVRSCKQVFYAILGNQKLTDEVLRTTFALVEQSLNAQSITAVSSNPNELDALTPNHCSSISSLATANDFDHRKRHMRAQAYANAIWSRWLNEYVPSLDRRSKWQTPSSHKPRTGDLVWICEQSSPGVTTQWLRLNH